MSPREAALEAVVRRVVARAELDGTEDFTFAADARRALALPSVSRCDFDAGPDGALLVAAEDGILFALAQHGGVDRQALESQCARLQDLYGPLCMQARAALAAAVRP